MNENIKAFLEKVEASPDLQAQFAQIRDPDEAYKLAASVQDGFTKEEFVSEMKKLYESQVADLSDEDIAKVAGGLTKVEETIVASVTSAVSGVGVLVGTMAAASAAA